jgi:7-cyano-7-deazaguanine reductase
MDRGTTKKDLERLATLGKADAEFEGLQVFPSHSSPGHLKVTLDCHEFTCRCPKTHQPDWATIHITYLPDKWIIETKSVKLYLETWREKGIFHEHLAKVICDDFVEALDPLSCEVRVCFRVRGGIAVTAVQKYTRSAIKEEPAGGLSGA